jgi:hypothetical protein
MFLGPDIAVDGKRTRNYIEYKINCGLFSHVMHNARCGSALLILYEHTGNGTFVTMTRYHELNCREKVPHNKADLCLSWRIGIHSRGNRLAR